MEFQEPESRPLTPERISELSLKMEHFIELELGFRVPFISLIYSPNLGLGFFTNRKSNTEVEAILETALDAVRTQSTWVALEGEIIERRDPPKSPSAR